MRNSKQERKMLMATGKLDGKSCKGFVMGFAAAMAMCVTANTVKDTKFDQSYPYSGKATIKKELGGVQLWENGPYWAECNVGATKPEEYGYYFWWGDTIGYTNTGRGWISVKDGTSIKFTRPGPTASTYHKSNSELLSAGYIDSTGNLVPKYDAAMAHLGSPWRMPTNDEIGALVNKCTTTWTTNNGVYGRLVTGKGAYSDKSIFLPAVGYGTVSHLDYAGSFGRYWSSSPNSDDSKYAWSLYLDSGDFYQDDVLRYRGRPVRPVREFAK